MAEPIRTFQGPVDFGGFALVNAIIQGGLKWGRMLLVDSVNGNDATAQRGDASLPFLTIGAALAAAVSGDLVWILPGNYDEAITIPTGVAIRGCSLHVVKIRKLLVTGATTLVTMGSATRLEDVSLELTSANHVNLTGVLFPGDTAATAKLRTATVTVDNSAAGTGGTEEVLAIDVTSTATPAPQTSAIRATTAVAKSSSGGTVRGILHRGIGGAFYVRDCNFVATRAAGSSGSYIGAEVNAASSPTLGLQGQGADGSDDDVSQTAGLLQLGDIELIHATAAGKGFDTVRRGLILAFADPGGLPGNATRFMRFGSEASSTTEIKLRINHKIVLKSLFIRATTGPGAGKTDVFTLRKNGADTTLTASLTETNTTASDDVHSVTFAAGDDLSVKFVSAIATGSSDVVLTLEGF